MKRKRFSEEQGIAILREHEAQLRTRLRALAHTRQSFGYRRLHVFLRGKAGL